MHCACHDWTRQGTEGFLGHEMCQGPDAWPQGEASIMRLDPDGCLVRRHEASDITITEDTGAGETAIGSEMPGDIPQQKMQKGV